MLHYPNIDPEMFNILGFSIVDPHCVPIYSALGDNTKKVDWILLDHAVASEYLTNKFLLKYNLKTDLTYEAFRYRNSNEHSTKDMRVKIESLIDLCNNNDTLNLFYNQDKLLYNKVTEKFEKFIGDATVKYGSLILNPKDSKDAWSQISWDSISWLRNE